MDVGATPRCRRRSEMKTSTWMKAIAVGALFRPVPAAGQTTQFQVVALAPEPALTATRCLAQRPRRSPTWDALGQALILDKDVAKARLGELEDSVSALAAARADDVDAQFLLAAVLGARAEVEGGRTKMKVAEKLIAQLDSVLAMDPEHGGALDLMGRLHAAVMRMDWLKRTIATRILGGAALRAASWDRAEHLLESAVAVEPCVGDHYYELAAVYANRGKRGLALDEIAKFFELGPSADWDPRVYGRATTLMEELHRGS